MALPSSSSSGAEKSLIRLHRAFKVDEAINTRKKHIVIIRFGNEDDPTCEEVDEWLEEEAKRLDEKDAVIYIVENESVPELVARFELSYDAAATIIFFLNNTVATILAGADVTQEKFKQTVAKLLQRRNRTAPYVENGSQNAICINQVTIIIKLEYRRVKRTKGEEEEEAMGNQKKPGRTTATENTAGGDEELHKAARSGDLEAVLRICSTDPLAINSRDKHSLYESGLLNINMILPVCSLTDVDPRLHLAAWAGQTKVVEFLSKKADVGAAAMDDMGAIHFASQKGHTEVVRILISAGVPIKSCNRKGMTALHYAAQGSHLELVKYLIKKGAVVNSKNKAGQTPVDLASGEEIRTFLTGCQTKSSSEVPNVKENDSKVEAPSSLQENADNGKVQDQDNELTKRKNDEDVNKGILPQAKKTKVALNHLIASDDTQDEEE
ncbi:OLC1v1030943C1 [Oldenlandia corymbosa var. corymbosa]|uniref:OLC1v1030943C1 n=1 Tax=Oldenlandia corymbosa var. corymbosa TaxID=529605 RepID=A0AAV1CHD7_OLDCO|nr:OLC1v1030943C1 [Oldenlandia corymbosa var. corymbosa]